MSLTQQKQAAAEWQPPAFCLCHLLLLAILVALQSYGSCQQLAVDKRIVFVNLDNRNRQVRHMPPAFSHLI